MIYIFDQIAELVTGVKDGYNTVFITDSVHEDGRFTEAAEVLTTEQFCSTPLCQGAL